jgi:hypothetical protein
MSRTSAFASSFIGGVLGGAAVTTVSNVGFGRIWNWLCVVFLPLWLFVLSVGAIGILGSGSLPVWGWASLILSALLTIFLINSAAKIAAPGIVNNRGVSGFVISTVRNGSVGRKIVFLLPALFLLLEVLGMAVFAAILSVAASIAIGVHVGKTFKKENAAVEELGRRLGSALGGELLPGSLFYGDEPGTFSVHPLPPAALALVNSVDELRPRIDSFAPEWEVRYLDTATLIVGPRTYAVEYETEAPLAVTE